MLEQKELDVLKNMMVAAFQKLEKAFGVFLLLLGGLQKDARHLFVALFLGLACKKHRRDPPEPGHGAGDPAVLRGISPIS